MVIIFQSTWLLGRYEGKDIGHRCYVSLNDMAKRLPFSELELLELVKQGRLNAYAVLRREGGEKIVGILESSIQLYPTSPQLRVGSECPNCNGLMQQVAREIEREEPPSNPPRRWKCDSCKLAVMFD